LFLAGMLYRGVKMIWSHHYICLVKKLN
jgi:hypothetical protein